MAGDDTIVVTEEARDMMRSLETNDPGVPSPLAIREVTGARLSTGASNYLLSMKSFATGARTMFQEQLESIRADCAAAVKALDDLSRQDDEIMAMLRSLDESTAEASEENQAALPVGSGPQIAPSPGGSGGLTAW